MRRGVTTQPSVAPPVTSMSDNSADPPSTGPIDAEILDRIAAHLSRSARFDDSKHAPRMRRTLSSRIMTSGTFLAGSHVRLFESDGSRPTTSASITPSNTGRGPHGSVVGTATRTTTTLASTSIRSRMHRRQARMRTIQTSGET